MLEEPGYAFAVSCIRVILQLFTVFILTGDVNFGNLNSGSIRSLMFAAQIERFSSSILLVVTVIIRFQFLRKLLENGYDPAVSVLMNGLKFDKNFDVESVSILWVFYKMVSPVLGVLGIIWNLVLLFILEKIKISALLSGKFDKKGKYEDFSENYQNGYQEQYEDLENARRDYVEYTQCLGVKPKVTSI